MAIKFKENSKEVKNAINEGIEEALKVSGDIVLDEAVSTAPIVTGALRDSLRSEVEKNKVAIGSDVEYALFVHEGTSTQRKQPFLKDAFYNQSREILSAIEEIFSKIK